MHEVMIALSAAGGTLTPRLVAMSIAAILAAAVLRGFTGFGFSMAAVPLLGLFMTPTQAVPIALGLQLLGSLIDFRSASKACDWPSLRWLMLGALFGSPIGTLILKDLSAPVARLVISLITLLAVAVLGRGFAFKTMPPRRLTSATGFISGLFNGLAAIPGPPAVAYYMSVPLARTATRASLLVYFLMTSVTATAVSLAVGLVTIQSVVLAVVGLPVMWFGTRIGERAFERGTDNLHRKVSIISLGVIALISAVKGIGELA